MNELIDLDEYKVNCRVGSLENHADYRTRYTRVNCRVGSLERTGDSLE